MHKLWRSVSISLAAIALLGVMGCSKQPVAIVNGQRVTRDEFYGRLEQAAGERVLADLIARKMLADAFTKSGLKLSDQEVNDEIANMKKQAPDEASWQQYLKQQGMTDAEFKEFVTFNLQVKKLAEKDVKVTEPELKKFFEKNREQFARPATVVLSEIVLSDKAKADEVRKQLNDPKASFATLARQYSISTFTRERGGRRPEEPIAGLMPEALRSTVSGMQVGQISQPVRADSSWYIIKVEEKHAAETPTYDKVKDKVREAYMYTNAKQVQDIIEGLRKDAKVQILDPKYQSMQQMFGAQQALPTFGAEGAKGGVNGAQPPAGAAPAPAPAEGAAPAPAAPAAPATQ
ncbi:MAG: peptidyl-prolyl cis-trans isomerase [Armatimonadota bacterium]